MTKIVQKDGKDGAVLRKIAKRVPKKDFGSKKLTGILNEMHDSLRTQDDGVALAAPQIGHSLRIFVVAPRVFKENPRDMHLVFINPEITKRSRDKKLLEEGCLSVRWWYGKIRRASRVSLRAYDEHGKEFEVHASGLLAQIFQHETDHLDGVLFIDNAKELKEYETEEELREMQIRRAKAHTDGEEKSAKK